MVVAAFELHPDQVGAHMSPVPHQLMSSALVRCVPSLLFVSLFPVPLGVISVCLLNNVYTHTHTSLTTQQGLLLVFRTNAAYDRFWEARKVWGSVTNVCRNLARTGTFLLHGCPWMSIGINESLWLYIREVNRIVVSPRTPFNQTKPPNTNTQTAAIALDRKYHTRFAMLVMAYAVTLRAHLQRTVVRAFSCLVVYTLGEGE